MRYWVFEDYPTNRARVHRASCGNCNDGRGKFGIECSPNCRWIGPYCSVAKAYEVAKSLNRNDTALCLCLR